MKPRVLWLIVALSSIWLSVILISVLAPDMITGSGQQHFPVAAAITWISGGFATNSLLKDIVRKRANKQVYMGVAILTVIIWLAIIPVTIFVPSLVTGSDPTQLPLAAILTPVAAAVVTGWLGSLIRALREMDWGDDGDEAEKPE